MESVVGVWGVVVVLRAIWSMYNQSTFCFRILFTKSCFFYVQVEFRQVYPLSQILFVMFIDSTSRCSLGGVSGLGS